MRYKSLRVSSWSDVSATQVSITHRKKEKGWVPTFSVDEENDILAKSLVIISKHGKHLDNLVGQEIRRLVDRIMRRDHELFVQHQLCLVSASTPNQKKR